MELGSENQYAYVEHLVLMIEAKRSISKGSNVADIVENASCDKDHSASSLIFRDSKSAIELSIEAMYEAKIKILRCSHQLQICFVIAVNFGYWIRAKAINIRNCCRVVQSKEDIAISKICCKATQSVICYFEL